MFPFDRPMNYGEMLNKIGLFTFFSSLGVTWTVARLSPSIAHLLKSTGTIEIQGFKIPFLYALVAIAIALIFRVVHMHDRISDLFGIRVRFDLNQILLPLCESVGLKVDEPLLSRLKLHRESLMERTYYAYASFEDPKISKALVLASIEVWTWYWILLEFIVLAAVACIVLFATRACTGAITAFLTVFVCTLLFCTHVKICGKKANSQVEEIVSDSTRAAAVKAEFAKP